MEIKVAGKTTVANQGVDKDTFLNQVWFHPGHTDDLDFTWKWFTSDNKTLFLISLQYILF